MLKSEFMELFLGKDGAKALTKATKNIPDLETLIVPTVFNTWLDKIQSYEGNLLGKSVILNLDPISNLWDGRVQIRHDMCFELNKAEQSYVVATLAVAYDLHCNIGKFKSKSLDGLNKTVSSLVGYNLAKNQMTGGSNIAAIPRIQIKPLAPIAPKSKQPSAQNLAMGVVSAPNGVPGAEPMPPVGKVNIPKIKLAKSEIQERCEICGINQFMSGNLKGCLCIRGILKNSQILNQNDEIVIENTINIPLSEFGFMVNTLKGI